MTVCRIIMTVVTCAVALPAGAQSRVYTNADLHDGPLSPNRPHVSAEQLAALKAYEFHLPADYQDESARERQTDTADVPYDRDWPFTGTFLPTWATTYGYDAPLGLPIYGAPWLTYGGAYRAGPPWRGAASHGRMNTSLRGGAGRGVGPAPHATNDGAVPRAPIAATAPRAPIGIPPRAPIAGARSRPAPGVRSVPGRRRP
jgi:hypothetical protein